MKFVTACTCMTELSETISIWIAIFVLTISPVLKFARNVGKRLNYLTFFPLSVDIYISSDLAQGPLYFLKYKNGFYSSFVYES